MHFKCNTYLYIILVCCRSVCIVATCLTICMCGTYEANMLHVYFTITYVQYFAYEVNTFGYYSQYKYTSSAYM